MRAIMLQYLRTERVNASKKPTDTEVTHVEWNVNDKARSAQDRETYQYLDNILF